MMGVLAVGAGLAAADREGSNDYWLSREAQTLKSVRAEQPINGRAKNVILFLGDGMGISTVTAARILAGQKINPAGGEEFQLNMEKLPYAAFSKTYSVNQQTSDSAPTMTAIVTGVKTKDKILGVGPSVIPDDYRSVTPENKLTNNILHIAKRLGKAAGIVTTTRITHATPAALYAHTPDRDWEDSADLDKASEEAFDADFPDIARQLIEFPVRNHLPQIDVVLGGGRSKFIPVQAYRRPGLARGTRIDGRNLVEEWKTNFTNAAYVTTRNELMALDLSRVDHLLGMFNNDMMNYSVDREAKPEPALVDMTAKALELLKKNDKGFFLMVEGGRIDHGHHAGNAYRALTETLEFDRAIGYAVTNTDPKDTLIIVTADHSHTFTLGGYAQRGNPILGLVKVPEKDGTPGKTPALDLLDKPYTSLAYANGPGYTGESIDQDYRRRREGPKKYPHSPKDYEGIDDGRPTLTEETVTAKNYLQESSVPLGGETHGGEDVPIFARGPQAHLLRGVREENYIFQVMKYALTGEE